MFIALVIVSLFIKSNMSLSIGVVGTTLSFLVMCIVATVNTKYPYYGYVYRQVIENSADAEVLHNVRDVEDDLGAESTRCSLVNGKVNVYFYIPKYEKVFNETFSLEGNEK